MAKTFFKRNNTGSDQHVKKTNFFKKQKDSSFLKKNDLIKNVIKEDFVEEHKVIKRDKNRPTEVPMLRKRASQKDMFVNKKEAIQGTSFRDPRFDDLSGELDLTAWKKNYCFLRDQRNEEKGAMKAALAKEKDPLKCKAIKKEILKRENQERELAKIEKAKEFKKQERENAIACYKEGKRPTFAPKKCKKEYVNNYYMDKLKNENKLHKYSERKEKKAHIKELKKMNCYSY